jgi:CHAD domain-containing protein
MAYRFDRSAPLEEGFHRIVHELTQPMDAAAGVDVLIHQTRKNCKKLRALIDLMRPQLPPESAASLLDIRALAGELSDSRDAYVALALNDKFTTACFIDTSPRSDLLEDYEACLTALARRGGLRRVHEDLRRAGMAMRFWQFEQFDPATITGRAVRAYRRARNAMPRHDKDPAAIHLWRKRAKMHGYHMRLLAEFADDFFSGRARLLGEMTELLGEHRDMALFLRRAWGDADSAQMRRQQVDLWTKASKMGRELLREDPEVFRVHTMLRLGGMPRSTHRQHVGVQAS